MICYPLYTRIQLFSIQAYFNRNNYLIVSLLWIYVEKALLTYQYVLLTQWRITPFLFIWDNRLRFFNRYSLRENPFGNQTHTSTKHKHTCIVYDACIIMVATHRFTVLEVIHYQRHFHTSKCFPSVGINLDSRPT